MISHKTFAGIIIATTLCANIALGVPYQLAPLEQERSDISISKLEEAHTYAKGHDLGIHNKAASPRFRTSESGTGYLNHDETNFSSETYLPFEYFGRLSKDKMEEGYFQEPLTLKDRTERALNSFAGAWYQMLMFQEPTLAVSGATLLNIASTKIAEYQRDRSNEIAFNASRPEIARHLTDEFDRCMASQIAGVDTSILFSLVNYSGFGSMGGVEAARLFCESHLSTVQFLNARGGLGFNGCEWLSIVMWGHLSDEIPMRMRAQFGDDEMCPGIQETGSGGSYIAYSFKAIPPEFSTRQVWYEEYERSVLDLQEILDGAAISNGGYLLSPDDLARINIRPGLKVTQDLVSAIEQGFDPLRQRGELVSWWAQEKANALVDLSCREARIAVNEAASSQATPYEKQRWHERVNAVCGALDELKAEMSEVARSAEVFSKILVEGDKAARKFSESSLIQARANKQRGNNSQGTWVLDGGMSPVTGLE